MQKKVVTLAVLGAFVSCSAWAQGVQEEKPVGPQELINQTMKDPNKQITGSWIVKQPKVVIKAEKLDQVIKAAQIDLGENHLVLDTTNTSQNLSYAVVNNSQIKGGANSKLEIHTDLNSAIADSVTGTVQTSIDVGTLVIDSQASFVSYLSKQNAVLDVKANNIEITSSYQNAKPDGTIFNNDGSVTRYHDFDHMSVTAQTNHAVKQGPSGKELSMIGKSIELKNDSKVGATVLSTGENLKIQGDLVQITNASGKAIAVDNMYSAKLATLDIQAKALQVIGDVGVYDSRKKNERGTLDLTFSGQDSFLTGNAQLRSTNAELSLTFADGAVWNVPAKQQKFALFAAAEPVADSQVSNLTLNGGLVNVAAGTNVHADSLTVQNAGSVTLADGSSLSTDNLTGQAQVNLVLADPKTAPTGQFEAVKANEGAAVQVGFVNENNQTLTADEVSLDMATKAQSQVKGVENTQVKVQEGKVNGAVTVGPKGEATVERNTLLDSTMQIASASTLSLNRIVMNDVRKRMGDLRASDKQSGVWARYDGGRLSGEQSLETKFSTFQAGIDTVPGENTRFGLAFSYTDGDTDFARGSNDMKGYSLAGYGTWFNQNGLFADVVARMAVMDSTMAVEGESAELDNVALSLSGEAGWRLNLTDMAYVEPQAELTYTYVDGENFDLGSTHFSMNDTHSLLARAGIAAGLKCPADKGDVYVRVSAVHEFLGDGKITASNGTVSNLQEIDGKDTWVEFGVGGNFNINDSTYVWADVERTQGATIEEDWRATVGVRYSF